MAQHVPAAFDRENRVIPSTPTIIRRKQVEARTGWSRSTIYLAVSQGRFPRPIRLGARSVGWVEAEVSEWLEARIEASRMAAK